MKRFSRSFNGGEVSPDFWGRIDDPKYQAGVAVMENFIALPHGPAVNRGGLRFVREVKDSTKKTRLIDFDFGVGQTFAIEMGAGYFRFHKEASTLILGSTPSAWNIATPYTPGDLVREAGVNYYCRSANSGVSPPNATFWYPLTDVGSDTIYEIPNPFTEDQIFDVHYAQSADIMTLTHPSHRPQELQRFSNERWVLSNISFAAVLSGPGSPSTSVNHNGSPVDSRVDFYTYKITAVTAAQEESVPSTTSATAVTNLAQVGCYIDITWSSVSGAVAYNVYKATSYGSFGYIGQTTTTQFRDTNYEEDLSSQPPQTDDPFSTDFPRAVSYFEQRRGFAGTTNRPQNLWLTKTGTERAITFSQPARDDDAIRIRLAALKLNVIEHLVPLNDLIALTSSTEFRIGSINGDAITPSTINVRPQSYVGCSKVKPVVINNNLIYNSIDGKIREFVYSFQINGYQAGNLSVRATHLFDDKEIVDMAFTRNPTPMVLCISSDGRLLAFTYVPEQEVGAWHRHTTPNGSFESVCAIREDNQDYGYVVVKRTIDGNDVRYIERIENRSYETIDDCFFLDSGVIYDGSPADTFSLLDHLEGEEVYALGDGAVFGPFTVTGGEITLPVEVSKCSIGLLYESTIETLPIDLQIEAFGQGRKKNINKVYARVVESGSFFAGPASKNVLYESKIRTFESGDAPPTLQTKEVELRIAGDWSDDGRIILKNKNPLPLNISSLTLEVALGS